MSYQKKNAERKICEGRRRKKIIAITWEKRKRIGERREISRWERENFEKFISLSISHVFQPPLSITFSISGDPLPETIQTSIRTGTPHLFPSVPDQTKPLLQSPRWNSIPILLQRKRWKRIVSFKAQASTLRQTGNYFSQRFQAPEPPTRATQRRWRQWNKGPQSPLPKYRRLTCTVLRRILLAREMS